MESNFGEWVSEIRDHIREHPKRAPLYFVFTLYLTVWYAITSRYPIGRNVYEGDWDLLIVLDACRVDTLREVADEYEFIEDVESVWSIGSQSAEWMSNTFTERHRDEISRTSYISANGYSESILERGSRPPANNTTPIDLSSWSVVPGHDFDSHIQVWKTYHDEEYRTTHPQPVTDHTIEEGRHGSADRIIAHYTQPHLPYVGAAVSENREPTELEDRGYELLEEGRESRHEVLEAYKETLRWVLDDVEELLQNIDAAKVVITSDHGEAFGEGKAYGHPEGFPHPVVRKVPWVVTKATDEKTRESDTESNHSIETDIEDHLRDLGYR